MRNRKIKLEFDEKTVNYFNDLIEKEDLMLLSFLTKTNYFNENFFLVTRLINQKYKGELWNVFDFLKRLDKKRPNCLNEKNWFILGSLYAILHPKKEM